MQIEQNEMEIRLQASMERLESAAGLLERTVAWLEARDQSSLEKVTAAIEERPQEELTRKLAEAERQIAELKAAAAVQSARRTIPGATTQLLAKQGIASLDSLEAGAVDAALQGLSIEQRIAVKSQLLRAGALI